jgi:hypothetical protein
MRDMVVRRLLDQSNLYNFQGRTFTPAAGTAYILDPLGMLNPGTPVTQNLGGGSVPRARPSTITTTQQAAGIFTCTDDLVAPLPENFTPPQPVGRPQNSIGGNPNPLDFRGDYTWFASVIPQFTSNSTSPTRFTVSVVVCYKRVLNPAAEQARAVTGFGDLTTLNGQTVALGGGSVALASAINDIGGQANGIYVKENDWVALCSTPASGAGICRWYRVAAISDDSTQLTLVGPDWVNPSPGNDKLVALAQNVVGVYTTTIDLDTDPTWKN